jgi:undecaprenyl-diphosphatase
MWAAVLGALQGATEFLPVSSSGHLSLAAGHRFNITVHAGTLVAVVWVYRRDVIALLRAAMRPTVASSERTMLVRMLVASLPLALFLIPGVEAWVVAMESQPRLVGLALWTTAAVLHLSFRGDRGATDEPSTEPPTSRQALWVGFAQVVAVLPGISRSGSTIGAGLAVGLDRAAAARFSFLISIVAITAASAKEALTLATAPAAGSVEPLPYVVGFASSVVVGLASLRGLLYLVHRGRVGVFVVYLLIVGGVAVVLG